MVDIPELSTWTMQNGKTFRFMDAVARLLLKKKYGTDNPPPYPVTSVNGQTGDVVVAAASRNIWYATCSTATGTAAKTATSATGDFVLATGNMVRIKFANTNNQTQPTLSVDGSTAKRIKNLPSENNINTQWWRAGEVIDLVYDGTDFIISDGGAASTSYYGKTILTNSTSSTSQSKAATAKAVKAAYDLADSKVDAAGAAAAAPVQSVNGATGAVVLDKGDVGLGNVDNEQQYSASNPPPYPVTSVNGSTGDVAITASGLGISDYITERGTSGDWTYVKYASKKFEAWCTKTVPNKASENSINSWYWTLEYLTLPSFTAAIECALANAHWGTGVAWGNVRSAGSSGIEVLIFGNQSTGTLYVRCDIRGTYT